MEGNTKAPNGDSDNREIEVVEVEGVEVEGDVWKDCTIVLGVFDVSTGKVKLAPNVKKVIDSVNKLLEGLRRKKIDTQTIPVKKTETRGRKKAGNKKETEEEKE